MTRGTSIAHRTCHVCVCLRASCAPLSHLAQGVNLCAEMHLQFRWLTCFAYYSVLLAMAHLAAPVVGASPSPFAQPTPKARIHGFACGGHVCWLTFSALGFPLAHASLVCVRVVDMSVGHLFPLICYGCCDVRVLVESGASVLVGKSPCQPFVCVPRWLRRLQHDCGAWRVWAL